MQPSIEVRSGSLISREGPASLTIVSGPANQPAGQATKGSEGRGTELRWEWTLEPTVPLSRPQPEFVPFHPVPPCVHDFITAVAQVAGVQCVVVEESEQHAIHITTFARPLTDDVRERV